MSERFPSNDGVEDKVSRGAFLRRTGALGMATIGIGELIVAPFANARTSAARGRSRMQNSVAKMPDGCSGGYSTCTWDNGACGKPCTPTGSSYCFHCTATPCAPASTSCINRGNSNTFQICCND
jgi:hypothetical protein